MNRIEVYSIRRARISRVAEGKSQVLAIRKPRSVFAFYNLKGAGILA